MGLKDGSLACSCWLQAGRTWQLGAKHPAATAALLRREDMGDLKTLFH